MCDDGDYINYTSRYPNIMALLIFHGYSEYSIELFVFNRLRVEQNSYILIVSVVDCTVIWYL